MTERFASHDEFFCAAFADKERYPHAALVCSEVEAIVIEIEFDSYFRQRTEQLTSKIETKRKI